MPEEPRLPALAAAVLVRYLMRSLPQLRSGKAASPKVVWREVTERGWSEWTRLVQFAIVVHPVDAPEYTLRVTFVSAVRERTSRREVLTTGCGR
jgi:hypothetical protein